MQRRGRFSGHSVALGHDSINSNVRCEIGRNHRILDPTILNGQNIIPSPPSSPTETELGSCETSHGGMQSSHHVGRQSKKAKDSAVRKKAVGRIQPRTQHRCNSRQSISGCRDRDDDDDDENDSVGSNSDQESVSGSKPTKRLFACPYYKYDSMRYISCARLRLTRVRDVKQHLNRRHRRPLYCPTCGNTFDVSQYRDAHIRARDCRQPPGGFGIEGITDEQGIALGRRVNRSLGETDQWFSIWKILFPGSSPPESPYLSNHYEETLGMIYNYWHRHKHDVVSDLPDATLKDDSISKHVVAVSSQIIDTLLLHFRSSSKTAMDPASSNPTSVEPASRTATAAFVPSSTGGSLCPTRHSAPLAPSQALQQLQQCSTRGQSTGISGGNIYAETAHTPVLFSQGPSPRGATTHADSMLSQELSPYSSDATQTSPYSQVDGSCTPYNFMTVSQLEPMPLTHVGGWDMDCSGLGWPVQNSNFAMMHPEDADALMYPPLENFEDNSYRYEALTYPKSDEL
jgi:hypothetical protein